MDQNALAIRQAQWEQIVAECNAAGISKKEWCAKNGIPEKSFYYWQRRIRQQIAEANPCELVDTISETNGDQNASSGNDLYEDYYISIYVPMTTGHTHGILVGSGAEMQDSGREHKANIVPKLYSSIVLGDLFAHEITKNSFSVESGDGDGTWGDNPEMTPANNVLKTQVTATIQIKNADAGA